MHISIHSMRHAFHSSDLEELKMGINNTIFRNLDSLMLFRNSMKTRVIYDSIYWSKIERFEFDFGIQRTYD